MLSGVLNSYAIPWQYKTDITLIEGFAEAAKRRLERLEDIKSDKLRKAGWDKICEEIRNLIPRGKYFYQNMKLFPPKT